MAGNTRGKLKEHFEGIHKNLDWCIHHVAVSATLIENQLAKHDSFEATGGDPEKEQAFFMENDMYKGVVALGNSISMLDELAQNIYKTF
jgi:hypothetical protein